MKKNYLRKSIAVILALVMVVMVIPASAYAAEKEPAGNFYFCMEKATIGQGYLIEPQKVPFYEGETLAQALIRFFDENGIEADCGTADMFYLACVKDPDGNRTADFPQYIKDADSGLNQTRNSDWLGEFDYGNMAGWVFKDNNKHSPVGASGVKLENGDIERFAFTVVQLGADCWATGWGETIVPEDADRDEMIKTLADFNDMDEKSSLLNFSYVKKAYDELYASGNDYTVKQEIIDQQVNDFRTEVNKGMDEIKSAGLLVEKIKTLGSVSLEDKEKIASIREEINLLSDYGKSLVSNINLLEKAEEDLAVLEQQEEDKDITEGESGETEVPDEDITEGESGETEVPDEDITEGESEETEVPDEIKVPDTELNETAEEAILENNSGMPEKEVPETGDSAEPVLWMLGLTSAVLSAIVIFRRKVWNR